MTPTSLRAASLCSLVNFTKSFTSHQIRVSAKRERIPTLEQEVRLKTKNKPKRMILKVPAPERVPGIAVFQEVEFVSGYKDALLDWR
ncbi:hypothetical protein D3C87_1039580 [compost metagenome]